MQPRRTRVYLLHKSYNYDQLRKGTHNFTVRAADAAGNIGEDQFSWAVNPGEAAKMR
jgi:hypothetical protein